MNSTYDLTLKEEPKVKIENFIETKSWRNFLEGLNEKLTYLQGLNTYLTQIFIIE